ncbi:MAG: S8 family serine peptidase [Methanospirillaceae archaeon]|nr:S8 family serine peptidase [Methanospirillaceae archaeon]
MILLKSLPKIIMFCLFFCTILPFTSAENLTGVSDTAVSQVCDFGSDLSSTLIATNAGESITKGDIIVRSSGLRDFYGVTGKQIRVGVIADGVLSLKESQEAGELPEVIVLDPGTGDEGTAMLEIVHDIAPDAALYFHSYGGNTTRFIEAVHALSDAGCRIICDDLCFFSQPMFEDGEVTRAVSEIVKKNDLIYVTVAGNFAQNHYQGTIRPVYNTSIDRFLHDFKGNGVTFIPIMLPPQSTMLVTMQWDDPWNEPVHDHDLLLWEEETGASLLSGENRIEFPDNPFEHAMLENNTDHPVSVLLQVALDISTDATGTIKLFIRGIPPIADESFCTPTGTIFGHAAGEDLITVGSVSADAYHIISPDSSQGPVLIRYPEQVTRKKPDICAPTNVQISGAGRFPKMFPGTSAAAPHVAGVIAQVWSAFPDKNSATIREALVSGATDLGESGWDPVYGYGLLNADRTYRMLYNQETPFFRL